MKTTYNKSEIMKRAWRTFNARKALGTMSLTFSECLKLAWNNAKKLVEAAKIVESNTVLLWDGVVLNTVQATITGKTFDKKEEIKRLFEAKWDSVNKAWVTTSEKMMQVIKTQIITEVKPFFTTSTTVKKTKVNGLCPKCGSYCYGDCRFN